MIGWWTPRLPWLRWGGWHGELGRWRPTGVRYGGRRWWCSGAWHGCRGLAGAALAPLAAGLIADRSSLQDAILLICVPTWILCAIFFVFAARAVPGDITVLREQMRERAEHEKALQAGVA